MVTRSIVVDDTVLEMFEQWCALTGTQKRDAYSMGLWLVAQLGAEDRQKVINYVREGERGKVEVE